MNGKPLTISLENCSRPGETITIAVRDFGGEGKPLALLHHANGFCAGTWKLVADRLIDDFHVIAVDARGHGDSGDGAVPQDFALPHFVRDLVAVANVLIKEHGADRIEYGIGSSLGGIVTAAAGVAQPGLFGRVALLDPPIHPSADLVEEFGLDIEVGNPVKSTLVAQTLKRRRHWPSVEEPRQSWREKGMFASWSDQAFELYLAECLRHHEDGSVALKCRPEVEAHIFGSAGSLGVREYAPLLAAPTLYVRASAGHIPAEFCRGTAGLFPNSCYEEIEGGHLLPLDSPDATAARLLAFAGLSPEAR